MKTLVSATRKMILNVLYRSIRKLFRFHNMNFKTISKNLKHYLLMFMLRYY